MANHEQYIKRPIISIQGIEGSYHDKAAQHYFGADYRPIMCDTFEEVFDTVANGDAHYGMSAVENSLYGPIGAVHDLLADASDIAITGEITLGIHHSLIGQQGATLADITDVHSHPVALAQCKDYIVRTLNGAKAHEESDTAASVPIVKALGRVTAAALASPDVAAKYGMMILDTNVEDNSENYTRFLALKRGSAEAEDADKTSLLIDQLDDSPERESGGLYRALGCFALNNINLIRIAPQPLQGRPWTPRYFIDIDGGASDPRIESALNDLEMQNVRFRLLGSYRQGETI